MLRHRICINAFFIKRSENDIGYTQNNNFKKRLILCIKHTQNCSEPILYKKVLKIPIKSKNSYK